MNARKFPEHYLREKPKADKTHVTSVNIKEVQREFLESNGLNLSAIVRDAIDSLMKGKTK